MRVMGSGGCEGVYRERRNGLVGRGEGIGMVYGGKGVVKEMEFIELEGSGLYDGGEGGRLVMREGMGGYGGVVRKLWSEELMEK